MLNPPSRLPQHRRNELIGAAIILACLAWWIVPRLTSHSPAHTLRVSLTVDNSSVLSEIGARPSEYEGKECALPDGYSDVRSGTPVTVTDAKGSILAASTLETGTQTGSTCVLKAYLLKVPKASFYSVEVGRRGKITNSYDDVSANGWRVDLTL